MLVLFIKFLMLHVVTYVSMHDLAVAISVVKHIYMHMNCIVDFTSLLDVWNQYFNSRIRVFYIHLILKYIFGISYRVYYGCEDLESAIVYDVVHEPNIISDKCEARLNSTNQSELENVRIQRVIYTVMIINMLIGIFGYMK